jgi:hypothetical protein
MQHALASERRRMVRMAAQLACKAQGFAPRLRVSRWPSLSQTEEGEIRLGRCTLTGSIRSLFFTQRLPHHHTIKAISSGEAGVVE